MRVFLVGFMGVGKSSTGRALARRLGALFWDLDGRVEASLGMSVAQIFSSLGEAAFRAEEARQLATADRFAALVVATGGGTFVQNANRELIRRLGVSVFLDVPWGEVLRRLPGKREERPLFATPEQAFALYSGRLPHYRQADLTLRPEKGEDPEAIAGRLAIMLLRSG
ncbi:MAG: shikimate kinase [Thermoanaerobaculales bacterium]|jgi:shikimate kinase